MNYLASAISEKGTRKNVNQDALMVRNRLTSMGNVCLAVICDGMGGLAEGEVASSHVVRRIYEWFLYRAGGIKRMDKLVFYLTRELENISQEIMMYGKRQGFAVGTTATILVLAGRQYAIVHVGDSRVYQLTHGLSTRIKQLTKDQSMNDYMLTQSVGATENVRPECIRGTAERGSMFLLCTDGFRHMNKIKELGRGLEPADIRTADDLEGKMRIFVERARKLGEQDDISVIGIKLV